MNRINELRLFIKALAIDQLCRIVLLGERNGPDIIVDILPRVLARDVVVR